MVRCQTYNDALPLRHWAFAKVSFLEGEGFKGVSNVGSGCCAMLSHLAAVSVKLRYLSPRARSVQIDTRAAE